NPPLLEPSLYTQSVS
nr:beta-glucosidase [Pichia capsulata, anamorph=Candida molischiana/35M5N, Peptide Partial Mutant, 15 aa] [Kuraishia capsulata]